MNEDVQIVQLSLYEKFVIFLQMLLVYMWVYQF